jgi:hypothetical protein
MAKRIPNSGAGSIKGDLTHEDVLYEHKYTDKESFALKTQMLEKTRKEAHGCGKRPAWIITFTSLKRDFLITEM